MSTLDYLISILDPDSNGPVELDAENTCYDVIVVGIMRLMRDSLRKYSGKDEIADGKIKTA